MSGNNLFSVSHLTDCFFACLIFMQIPNESGFSNSSMQPSKGNELVDEDVDIVGGNDPPISNYPPLEIEKDGTNRNSKCSSSSSSSSESGSSSSDTLSTKQR
uniref:Transcription factor GTE10-like n=1 Tax=Cicer arietinum TaxID=3827 RepID=A0A3Q7YFG2_CICAR|nr:transcription factor GTE10-like [Cicer arietinum]